MSSNPVEPPTPRASLHAGADCPWWRRDLAHPGWIIAKGLLFLVVGALAVALAFLHPGKDLRFAFAYALSVWAFCRFYYFAFYVITHYVDASHKFSGLFDFFVWLCRRLRRRASERRTGDRS